MSEQNYTYAVENARLSKRLAHAQEALTEADSRRESAETKARESLTALDAKTKEVEALKRERDEINVKLNNLRHRVENL